MSQDPIDDLETRLGHRFRSRGLLENALTHSSHAHEAAGGAPDNEGLEFLGDAVLSFLMAEMLYRRSRGASEGTMSRTKAHLVSDASLARIAGDLRLGEALRLGVGEERSGGRGKASILSGALEAVLAAVFLDSGTRAARSLVRRLFLPLVRRAQEGDDSRDAKTRLQELLQGHGLELPSYTVVEQSGPEHRQSFRVCTSIGEKILGEGEGRTKKSAEQRAARQALAFLRVHPEILSPVGAERSRPRSR